MRTAIVLDDKSWYAYYHLGQYLSATETDQTDAIAKIRRAMELAAIDNANPFDMHWGLAKALAKSGDLAGAIEEQRKAVLASPRNDWLYADLGSYLVRADRELEAEKTLGARRKLMEELIAESTGSRKGFLILRLAYEFAHSPVVRIRDPEKALTLVSEGLKLRTRAADGQPTQHDRSWFLGPALYRNGQYAEALKEFQDTGENGATKHGQLFLALTHRALGNEKRAQAAWSNMLGLPPSPRLIWPHVVEEARAIMEAPR